MGVLGHGIRRLLIKDVLRDKKGRDSIQRDFPMMEVV